MALDAGSSGGSKGPKPIKGHVFHQSGGGSTSSSGQYYSGSSGGGAPTTSYSSSSTSGTPSYGSPAPPPPGGSRSFPKPPKPEPKPPSIKKYLGTDEQYQRDRAALIKNFRNLKLTNKENRGNVKMDKRTTLSRLREEEAENLKEMEADFAARGLFGGAEYLNKEQDFKLDYLDQRADARKSASRSIQQLLRDLRNAKTLREENLAQARLEAIRRRAAEYGIKE